jgi:AcrR family transcriptional regulator
MATRTPQSPLAPHAPARSDADDAARAEGARGGLRQRKKERQRQQILETAVELFRKHGYENTRIADISELLEISQPTFFRYFPSKDAILQELALEAIRQLSRALGRHEPGTPVELTVQQAYAHFADLILADLELSRMVLDPACVGWLKTHPPDASMPARLRLIQEAQQRGELNAALEAEALSQILGGIVAAVILPYVVKLGPSYDLKKRLHAAIEVFFRGARP